MRAQVEPREGPGGEREELEEVSSWSLGSTNEPELGLAPFASVAEEEQHLLSGRLFILTRTGAVGWTRAVGGSCDSGPKTAFIPGEQGDVGKRFQKETGAQKTK